MSPAAAIALSGLAAAGLKLTVSAGNLANADDASAVGAAAFQPAQVVTSPAPAGGVTANAVSVKPGSLLAYDPGSPLAGVTGMIDTPDIDPVSEISNQFSARHAFAASLNAFQAATAEEKTLLDMKF
jgi:flagellar basal-body rod protein FlgC